MNRRKQRKRLRKTYSKAQNGRSDRTQTCGLMVPNHQRYQLRHAPIYLIIPQKKKICKWSNLWSNHFYRGFCERVECRKSQCLQGFSAFFASGYLGGGVLLPNVARYQLRHTPKCEKYSIFRSISVSGQICGQNILSVFF